MGILSWEIWAGGACSKRDSFLEQILSWAIFLGVGEDPERCPWGSCSGRSILEGILWGGDVLSW